MILLYENIKNRPSEILSLTGLTKAGFESQWDLAPDCMAATDVFGNDQPFRFVYSCAVSQHNIGAVRKCFGKSGGEELEAIRIRARKFEKQIFSVGHPGCAINIIILISYLYPSDWSDSGESDSFSGGVMSRVLFRRRKKILPKYRYY